MFVKRIFMPLAAVIAFWSMLVVQPAYAQKAQKPMKTKGVLHSIEDGAVLLAIKVSEESAAQLVRAGFQRISKRKDIADRTILKGRLFLAYNLSKKAPSAKALKRKIGSRVELTLQKTSATHAVVIGVK